MRHSLFFTILFFWLIILIMYLYLVFLNNKQVTKGYNFEDLNREIEEIKIENQIIEKELYQNSSLKMVDEKARSAGFDKAKKILYIY